ncbi:MAG: sugar O-acetyltransferase [Lachnospiraceae bacterium]|nr:sugar O-acetyltransferase [Lachnospiraceae bacterium]
MNQKERMLSGLPYKAWLDNLKEERERCREILYELNTLPPKERSKIPEIVKKLFGKVGEGIWLEPPFHCDYGWNIEVGDNFFANFGFTVLDVGKVSIGDNVQIAPNVSIYTAGHPLHPDSRNSGYEYGIPVTIGNNVWLGGNVVILPGVTIGDNAVIGAGSVVTKDIPENMLAAGNPCKIIREITDADRDYYFKDRKFDVEDY